MAKEKGSDVAFLSAFLGLFMVFVVLPFALIVVIIGGATVIMFGILKWRKVSYSEIAAGAGDSPPHTVFDGRTGPRGILAEVGPNTPHGEWRAKDRPQGE